MDTDTDFYFLNEEVTSNKNTNFQHPAANNPKPQPEVIVLDKFAAIKKSLLSHPQREEILEEIQNYQS